MSELTLSESTSSRAEGIAAHALRSAAAQETCEECLGSGGWFRYEPALDPAPGLLYLSCMHCRGSGRTTATAY